MTKKLNHKQFRQQVLNAISPSFCAAKWLNASIWLNYGVTASCHNTPPHAIDPKNLVQNPSALHNTKEKFSDRRKMLQGVRPANCDYCWNMEDLNKNVISDRVFKSEIYSQNSIKALTTLPVNSHVLPKTLELAFDNICNFACSYCSSVSSSSWNKDLKVNGPYQMLKTSNGYKNIYAQNSNENIYIKAFWQWWPELKNSLDEIRLTGGEPLLSAKSWLLLDDIAKNKSNIRVALNSNLGWNQLVFKKLIKSIKAIPNFELYASNECVGDLAEFVRDGIKWERWKSYVEQLTQVKELKCLHFMMTASVLSLEGLPDFIRFVLSLRKKSKVPIRFTLNIVRFPFFQNVLILPKTYRLKQSQMLLKFIKENKDNLLEYESELIERLAYYLLSPCKSPHSEFRLIDYKKDLQFFIKQYSRRRSKDYKKVLSKELSEFIDSI